MMILQLIGLSWLFALSGFFISLLITGIYMLIFKETITNSTGPR